MGNRNTLEMSSSWSESNIIENELETDLSEWFTNDGHDCIFIEESSLMVFVLEVI